MLKRFILAAVLLVLVFGGVIGFKLYKQAATDDYLSNRPIPAVHVNGTLARAVTWAERLDAIGSLRARQGVDIKSEVAGVIERIHAGSGDSVAAGDLLVQLDDTVDQAVLKSATVRLEQARRNFERDRSLFERGLVSEDEFDASRSEFKSAEALVEETRGIIDKKTIRAPFAGQVGIHNLADGHYLEAGDEVVTLQALDKLYLDLHLPEKELERLRVGQGISFSVPSHSAREFDAEVRFIDVLVQPTTRNVLVRAEVENDDRELLPGMFASATLILDGEREVVAVPRQAVAFSLYGETVFLLAQGGEGAQEAGGWLARRQPVTSGEARGDWVEVDGLEAGAMLALDTQHRLLDGTPVIVENLASLQQGKAAVEFE